MIYFLQAKPGDPIKIGTTVRLSKRLSEIQQAEAVELGVLGVMDGSFADESAVHRKFLSFRLRGEWFAPDPALLAFIAAETHPWDGEDERPATPVRMDAEVVRIARIVAAYRGITLAEYISERLRPLADADLLRHQRQQRHKDADAAD